MEMRDVLVACLERAGAVLREFRESQEFTATKKRDKSLVTDVDVRIERELKRMIRSRFPTHGIIGEEEGIHRGDEYTWVIDPIDGTAPFVMDMPEYGTLIAVLKNHEPVLAGMFLPCMPRRYLAERGKGTTMNGTPVRVSERDRLSDTLVYFSTDAKDEATTMREATYYGRVVMKSQYVLAANGPIGFGYVADGRAGVVVNLHTKIWDIVAPSLLIQEAGGVATDPEGNPFDFNISDPETEFEIVAGSPELHKQALECFRD